MTKSISTAILIAVIAFFTWQGSKACSSIRTFAQKVEAAHAIR